jgi:flavin-dependent dehydrogenase
MSNARTKIDIYGAGLAGLVASINLAREDFKVRLFDRHRIGGNPEWHPSVQTTILKPEQTWEYIGVDLSDCFRRVDSITFYRYGRKKTFVLENMYVCERGSRKGALDTYLYEKAIGAGVTFHPVDRLDVDRIASSQNTVIATGLETQIYEQLGIPYVPIYGYRGVKRTHRDTALISYMEKCTNHDFAYLAANRGLLFALLFSRQELARHNLDEFRQTLEATEGIQISKWTYSTGAIPTKARLFHDALVLAGTLSGMIDPFLLHGVSGALTSGKIAAQAFMDRDRAAREFRWFAKNFELKKRLKALSVRLPLKQVTFPLMMLVDSRLRGVGFV